MFKTIGYYICELMETPKFLENPNESMLSVSGCFGGVHPDLSCCFFQNDQRDQRMEYKKKLNLSEEMFDAMKREISNVFEKKLAIDGRFLDFSVAQHFCRTYFSGLNCVIVSVSTTDEYVKILDSEMKCGCDSIVDLVDSKIDENELIGFDIIGWDMGGFHSFLCNNLHKELANTRFNQYGLLDNTFEEVVEFSNQIQGKGEPVEWIPCRIGRCLKSFIVERLSDDEYVGSNSAHL